MTVVLELPETHAPLVLEAIEQMIEDLKPAISLESQRELAQLEEVALALRLKGVQVRR